jgi:hypothetical protein
LYLKASNKHHTAKKAPLQQGLCPLCNLYFNVHRVLFEFYPKRQLKAKLKQYAINLVTKKYSRIYGYHHTVINNEDILAIQGSNHPIFDWFSKLFFSCFLVLACFNIVHRTTYQYSVSINESSTEIRLFRIILKIKR